jgi:hypothetical protein
MFANAKLDGTGHRWVAALSTYDFDIKYRPGKSNVATDVLSRLDAPADEKTITISSDSINTISNLHTTPCIGTISISEQPIAQLHDPHGIMRINVEKGQKEDPKLLPWIHSVYDRYKPKKSDLSGSFADTILFRNFDKLNLINNILYREVKVEGRVVNQLAVPSGLVGHVLRSLHNNMEHPGREKTLGLLRDQFFCPGQY